MSGRNYSQYSGGAQRVQTSRRYDSAQFSKNEGVKARIATHTPESKANRQIKTLRRQLRPIGRTRVPSGKYWSGDSRSDPESRGHAHFRRYALLPAQKRAHRFAACSHHSVPGARKSKAGSTSRTRHDFANDIPPRCHSACIGKRSPGSPLRRPEQERRWSPHFSVM
jgi:hypothetical protein